MNCGIFFIIVVIAVIMAVVAGSIAAYYDIKYSCNDDVLRKPEYDYEESKIKQEGK